MDDQPMREIDKGKDTMRRAFGAAETEVGTIAGIASEKIDQAKTIASDTVDHAKMLAKNAGETINDAATMARAAGEQAWSAAGDAATTAQDLARQARDQAAAASDTLLEEGAKAGEYLRRNVNEYPLTALLVAGALGYVTAYLMHACWQSSDRAKNSG